MPVPSQACLPVSAYAFDVFLSYACDDCEFARKVAQWLRCCGLRVWIDEEQLVPGYRFRVGLQQGLQESRHMVALLTDKYSTRPWTQRELDLFDLDAVHSERRVIGVKIDPVLTAPLDQVFLVHQRVQWASTEFDAEAFWKLYCGLTNTRPGPRETWNRKGNKLVRTVDSAAPPENVNKRLFADSVSPHSTQVDLILLVQRILSGNAHDWQPFFTELRRTVAKIPFDRTLENLITMPWAIGFAEFAAVVALAVLPKKHHSYSPWPFVDLSCLEIVSWFLLKDALTSSGPSEIWLSWAISQQSWDALPSAAARAPNFIAEHFSIIAKPAVAANNSFDKFEKEYNYGIMITPWNHFHLAWLAARLGDVDASRAHASRLCSTTKLGDVRTGRFLNRLTTWRIFSILRKVLAIKLEISEARQTLGMLDVDAIPSVQGRLTDIWRFVNQ